MLSSRAFRIFFSLAKIFPKIIMSLPWKDKTRDIYVTISKYKY